MLTEIYNNMRTKYGFGDGNSIPYGIGNVRKKIIDIINAELSKNSSIEAYPCDRVGLHNWCLIEYIDKRTGQPVAEPNEIRQILHKAELDGWSINMRIEIGKLQIDY